MCVCEIVPSVFSRNLGISVVLFKFEDTTCQPGENDGESPKKPAKF